MSKYIITVDRGNKFITAHKEGFPNEKFGQEFIENDEERTLYNVRHTAYSVEKYGIHEFENHGSTEERKLALNEYFGDSNNGLEWEVKYI